MKNNLLLLLLIIGIVSACNTPAKLVRKGEYEWAVRKAVKKLHKKPDHQKSIIALEKAYTRANEADMKRIEFLKKEGRPDAWAEIHTIYEELKARQELVNTLPQLVVEPTGRIVELEVRNYDDELIKAQKNAAEYYYARGQQSLKKGDRHSAREAFTDFRKVKEYYPDFRDVGTLITEAQQKGYSHVLFQINNQSGVQLPEGFEAEMKNMPLGDLNHSWVKYDTREVQGRHYHFVVQLNLQEIVVSPERIQGNKEVHTKEVQDGWEYELDEDGNVMQDSLGNDIKQPKYKTIKCIVSEQRQMKSARVRARLEYIDNDQQQVIRSFPLAAESNFVHSYYQAIGDLDALDKPTLRMIGGAPVPFPPDLEMIMMSADILKAETREALGRYRRYVN